MPRGPELLQQVPTPPWEMEHRVAYRHHPSEGWVDDMQCTPLWVEGQDTCLEKETQTQTSQTPLGLAAPSSPHCHILLKMTRGLELCETSGPGRP